MWQCVLASAFFFTCAPKQEQQSNSVPISVSPSSSAVLFGGTKQFTATMNDGSQTAVVWSIQEGPAGGTISPDGLFSAGSSQGVYHVVAAASTDPKLTGSAPVVVINNTPGSWSDVTPHCPDDNSGAGKTCISLKGDYVMVGSLAFNYGAAQPAADPTHPGTVYMSVDYQGIWKSTDAGINWSKVSNGDGPHGSNPGPMDSGGLGLVLAPDGSYMLTHLLYPINGFSNGAWKSVDGGVTWNETTVGAPNDDVGDFHIDPNDKTRVIVMGHTGGHVFESHDSGATWTDQGMPGTTAQTGTKTFWIDDDHLLAVYGWGDPAGGPALGTRSRSTWPWTWTWTQVATVNASTGQQGPHGGEQIFVDSVNLVNGRPVIYVGGMNTGPGGIDQGTFDTHGVLTFTRLSTPGAYSGVVVGTPTRLYSTSNYANLTGFSPNVQHAIRVPGDTWVADTVPATMTNGWRGAAVTQDAAGHYVIIGGNDDAGIWRYLEP
jgi:hypothetical protein